MSTPTKLTAAIKLSSHDGHVDFLHNGHLHNAHGEHVDEHVLEVSNANPSGDAVVSRVKHADEAHGADDGHLVVQHGDHFDHIHDGNLQHTHEGHVDNHGAVTLLKS